MGLLTAITTPAMGVKSLMEPNPPQLRIRTARAAPPQSGPHRAGFTLIELLVVVSIIALLMAILLPTLAAIRVRAHQATSASNMRQIGLAMQMYQDDYAGWFPQTTHSNPEHQRAWIFVLQSYLDTDIQPHPQDPSREIEMIGEVRICPADPRATERLERGGTSYIMNDFLSAMRDSFGRVIPEESFGRREDIPQPSRTITTFVGADDLPVSHTADHTHARDSGGGGWTNWNAVLADIQPDRYSGSSNYLYADGHVTSHAAEDKRERIESGDNFARPPGR